ncbi:MAG: hypothetical protein JO306_00920 [Gemmatimonadetes bacterium]|nr:hypothetical protein [Gemmatimonadota bacterium]
MSRRGMEAALWALALVLSLTAWMRVRHAVPAVGASVPDAALAAPAPVGRVPVTVLASAAAAARDGDVFRLDRAAPPVRFAATPGAVVPAGPPAPPPQPHAMLVLAGVIGPPWQALIEGIPGHAGAVVLRQGEKIEDLRVISITRDRAVVQGADTTWRLTLKRNWQ